MNVLVVNMESKVSVALGFILWYYGFDGIRRAVLKAPRTVGELERLLRLMCQAVTSPKTLRPPLYPM